MNLPAILQLGADYENRTAYVSGLTYAVLLSAYEYIGTLSAWCEDENTPLSEAEIDTIKSIVARVYDELDTNPMIGQITAILTENTPNNVILCDGSYHLKSDYPQLYAVIHDALKDTSGFWVPDLRNKFIYGAGNGVNPLATGGSESVVLGVENLPPHHHTISPSVSINIDLESAGVPDISGAGYSMIPQNTSSVGDGVPVQTMPPYIAVKYGVIAR